MNIIRDKLTLTGAVLGTASFLLPLITLKPNRIDDGTALSWLEVGALIPFAVVLCSLILLFIFSLISAKDEILLLKSIAAYIAFIFIFYTAGPLSGRMLDDSLPFGRITYSSGFWIMLAALSVVLNSVLQQLKNRRYRILFQSIPLIIAGIFIFSGSLDSSSILMEFALKKNRVISEIGKHLRLAGTAVFLALLLGIPLGILSAKKERTEKPVFYFLNSVQTIPSLALFGLLIAPLSYLSFKYPVLREMGIQGVGSTPALIALTLYALLPVARNTYIGITVVDKDILQAGRGMGMSPLQLFTSVEVPIAMPVILTGIRVSAIQAVGNTAVAALIGAGGLGTFIFQGLGQGAPDLILLGVIPLIALAVILDRLLLLIIIVSVSPGLVLERKNHD